VFASLRALVDLQFNEEAFRGGRDMRKSRRRLAGLIGGALLGLPSAALAQEQTSSAPECYQRAISIMDCWVWRADLEARGAIGDARPVDFDEIDWVDESDFEASIRFTRKLSADASLQLRLGVTSVPFLLDERGDQSPRSAAYIQLGLGETEFSVTDYSGIQGRKVPEDGVIPFLRYRFTRIFPDLLDGFPGDQTRDEQRFTAGARYRDIRGIMCEDESACGRGFYYDLEGALNGTTSTDSTRSRYHPSVRLDVVSRPIGSRRLFRFYGEAFVEQSWYTEDRVPTTDGTTGERRRDTLSRFGAGVDLTDLANHIFETDRLTFRMGVRRDTNASNNDGKDFGRVLGVLSLGVRIWSAVTPAYYEHEPNGQIGSSRCRF
jgi:hypothetical protein